jgi:uncharacterized protein (TIGR03067 family)
VADWFLAGSTSVRKQAEKDMASLQGTWELLPQGPGSAPSNIRLIVEGDRRILKSGDVFINQSIYRLNPATTPRSIDVIPTEGALRGALMLGVYALDGDTLRMCLARDGDPRPTGVTTEPEAAPTAMVFRRLAGR